MATTYLTNDDGSHIVEFQFSPFEVVFTDENKLIAFNYNGRDDSDVIYISGAPEEFKFDIFVDRTDESLSTTHNISGFGVLKSSLPASPKFLQYEDNKDKGVYRDVFALSKFLKPKGYSFDGEDDFSDAKKLRSTIKSKNRQFNIPEPCTFIWGDLWKTGFIKSIDYRLSVPTKELIPLRMEASVIMSVTAYGILK